MQGFRLEGILKATVVMRERTPFDPTPLFYPGRLLFNIMYRYQVIRQEDQGEWRIWDSRTKQYLGMHFPSKKRAKEKVRELEANNIDVRVRKRIIQVLNGNDPEKGMICCSHCGTSNTTKLASAGRWVVIDEWQTRIHDKDNVSKMHIKVMCKGCDHVGWMTLTPNPIEEYETELDFIKAMREQSFKVCARDWEF
jgi:hypothetical protein